MAIQRPTQEWVEAAGTHGGHTRLRAEVVNAAVLAVLASEAPFEFRGVLYEVPRVPFLVGAEIANIRAAYIASDDETERAGLLARVAVLARRLARPAGLWRRFLYRVAWRRNPFMSATRPELEGIAGFLAICRMKSEVRYPTLQQEKTGASSSTPLTS